MAETTEPEVMLLRGVATLDQILNPAGFILTNRESAKGSGGLFAWGDYVRGDRRLELHYRYALGLVTYHIGAAILDHETYLRYLGRWDEHRYPDFSTNPLDSFSALGQDLQVFCSDFITGDGAQFVHFASQHRANPTRFKGLRALKK